MVGWLGVWVCVCSLILWCVASPVASCVQLVLGSFGGDVLVCVEVGARRARTELGCGSHCRSGGRGGGRWGRRWRRASSGPTNGIAQEPA